MSPTRTPDEHPQNVEMAHFKCACKRAHVFCLWRAVEWNSITCRPAESTDITTEPTDSHTLPYRTPTYICGTHYHHAASPPFSCPLCRCHQSCRHRCQKSSCSMRNSLTRSRRLHDVADSGLAKMRMAYRNRISHTAISARLQFREPWESEWVRAMWTWLACVNASDTWACEWVLCEMGGACRHSLGFTRLNELYKIWYYV